MKWRTYRAGGARIFFAKQRDLLRLREIRTAQRWLQDNLDHHELRSLHRELIGGPGGATETEILEALARAIAQQQIVPVILREPHLPLDPPQYVPLADLAEEPEPPPLAPAPSPAAEPTPFHFVRIRVVDQRGRPVPGFGLTLDLPGQRTEKVVLGPTATVEYNDIERNGACTATVSPLGSPSKS